MRTSTTGNLLRTGICLLLSLFFCAAAASGKEGARIDDVALMNTEHDLLLYFSLKDSFTEEMEKGVKNGIPVTFSFLVELYQVRPGVPDRKIVSYVLDHTLNCDSLKQEFAVEKDEGQSRVISLKSFAEAKAAMTAIHDFKLIDLGLLESGNEYVLKLKAHLAKKTLPLNFQYIIPFWQLWKFETEWYSLSFIYGNPESTAER